MLLISRSAANPCAMFESSHRFQIIHRFTVRGVISILLALLSVRAVTAQSAQDHASAGISLAKQGKLAEAESELQQAVHAAPAVAVYRAQLGSIFGLEGKWNEALGSFQKAVDLEPDNINFRRETAAVQWQLGLLPSAEKNLSYVLEKHPDDPGATLLLGLVKERETDYATAARLLDKEFDLVVTQPDRTVALFHSLMESGQRSSLPKIVDVLRLNANNAAWGHALSQCAQIAASAGDFETAISVFSLIPANEPGKLDAGFQLAKLLYSQGHVSEAEQLLTELSKQDAGNADLQVLLGNCLEAERQPALAIEAYQRAIAIAPTRVEYYQDLISLLLDLGKTDDAAFLIDRARSLAPKDARPRVWKGILHLRKNQYKLAIESYSQASRLDPSNADAVLGMGAVYFVAGQNSAAIAQYRKGMAHFPNDPRFYIACAETLLASPDSLKLQAEAKNLLERAVKIAPQSAEGHYQLGQLALQQKRFKDAENEFLHSLKSDPNQSKTHFALSALYRRLGRTEDANAQFEIYQHLKSSEDRVSTNQTRAEGKP
jgi:tetratricopeptide (TPR) repeat protein